MKTTSELQIKGLKLSLFLGWPQEERIREQVVLIDIRVMFPIPPKACETDHLEDTFCYHELTTMLREKTHGRHFHLIEHLSRELFNLVIPLLPSESQLEITITKHPNIEGLTGGVCFRYGTSS